MRGTLSEETHSLRQHEFHVGVIFVNLKPPEFKIICYRLIVCFLDLLFKGFVCAGSLYSEEMTK